MGQISGAIIGVTVVLISVFVPLAFFAGSVGSIYHSVLGGGHGHVRSPLSSLLSLHLLAAMLKACGSNTATRKKGGRLFG
jgi:multidrug efflux pump